MADGVPLTEAGLRSEARASTAAGALLDEGGRRNLRLVGLAIVTLSLLVAAGSFYVLTGASAIEPTPTVWAVIWIVNGLLVLLVIALVATETTLLLQARALAQAGAGLQLRMAVTFAAAAAVPAVIVAVVATISLNQGLDRWFSERTKSMFESSRLVARTYMLEHSHVLRDDIIWTAGELERAQAAFAADPTHFQRILTALAITRSLPFASLVRGDGTMLMRAQINTQSSPPQLPDDVLQHVVEGAPTLISPGDTQFVGAVVRLRGYDGVYLFVARPVNAGVLEFMRLTDDNFTDYRRYESNRLVFQITFTIVYSGFALVVLLAALWIGIALANRFVDPIRNLMIASGRVSAGDLDVEVPVEPIKGELRDLSKRFNTMTRQLRSQRVALLEANATNEKRRQFTEAVVAGVSAGVVGLDAFGAVTLVNARASEMIGVDEVEAIGRPLGAIVPALAPLIEHARTAWRGQARDQIEIGAGPDYRTYQVQITREGTVAENKGHVVTLDDITDLLSAQRTGAWADVARRIAHEIKNPLTPIQLAAERLRRRYAGRLEGDLDIFDKSINTILRQVGDIGRMVDEFSSFARMPAASPIEGELCETIRNAVFLESVRLPEMQIDLDLPASPVVAFFDPRLISQVLTNLIKNSVESIEFVGLNIIDIPRVVVALRVETDLARLSVSDNGRGWPKENRQRLLEPYMTTRDKGTGLGLAIVARIIEQHGGGVELADAAPDPSGRIGASFIFTLPLAPRGVSAQTDTVERPPAADLVQHGT